MKVLIIEDEKDLLDSILTYLKSEGFICEFASNFKSAIEKIGIYDYDCIIVDINLPDGSGFDIVKNLKKNKNTAGIIIVTARHSIDDRLKGLDLGADDYLIKPFHLSELNARIKSIVRRIKFSGDDKITFGIIEVNTSERAVYINNKIIDLTKKEYELLLFLISNQNRVITKESLAEHIWGDYIDAADSFDFVYSHIKNLRKKMAEFGAGDYIQTVYGVGYKFIIK